MLSEKRRFEVLLIAVDEYLNNDVDMEDCDYCDYDPKSVTPADGHEIDCPIRKLSDAYLVATGG